MEHKEATTNDTNTGNAPPVVIPWGLQERDLAPSSMKVRFKNLLIIQDVPQHMLKAFTSGQATRKNYAKDNEDAKKKVISKFCFLNPQKQQEETAKIYEEYVDSFATGDKKKLKSTQFTRGETIIIGATKSEIVATELSSNYVLAPRETTKLMMNEETTKTSEKKKRSIDELKEELEREKQQKEIQQQVKNLLEEQANEVRTPSTYILELPGAKVNVIIPSDAKTAAIIHHAALWVAREGIEFQEALFSSLDSTYKSWKDRFPFLSSSHPLHPYYLWIVYYIIQQIHHPDSAIVPSFHQLEMVEGGPIWNIPFHSNHPYFLDLKKLLEEKNRKIPSSLHQTWLSILGHLSLQRQSIRDAMLFALQNAQYSSELIQSLTFAFMEKDASLPSKLARLFLISDILYNSGSRVPHAASYRSVLETHLITIFEHLAEVYRQLPGRLTAQNMKEQILRLLQIWTRWSVYSSILIDQLSVTFLGKSKSVSDSLEKSKTESQQNSPAVLIPLKTSPSPVEDSLLDGVAIDLNLLKELSIVSPSEFIKLQQMTL